MFVSGMTCRIEYTTAPSRPALHFANPRISLRASSRSSYTPVQIYSTKTLNASPTASCRTNYEPSPSGQKDQKQHLGGMATMATVCGGEFGGVVTLVKDVMISSEA
jgi:hypothetical protein